MVWELLGPVRPDPSWQAAEGKGFDLDHFTIDWDNQVVICPQGKRSQKWHPNVGRRGKPNILVEFRRADCQVCGVRDLCMRNKKQGAGNITLQRREAFEALRAARQRQEQPDFQTRYALRAGVEGTISQAMFGLGARRTRYRGLPKVHLQHLLVAAAMNLARVMNWLAGIPRSQARLSPFAKLAVC